MFLTKMQSHYFHLTQTSTYKETGKYTLMESLLNRIYKGFIMWQII
jgi:hypothetical protein